MEPFYFGEPGGMLFGVYHPPYRGAQKSAGIILCYPMGQEYIRAHRAFLRLAVLLSMAGFHVLRFDHYGCGDSAGDFDGAGIHRWIEDIGTAIEELQSGCDTKHTYMVGLRLGATLSVLASLERDDIDGLVLWEPVVGGAVYIDELIKEHNAWLRGSFAKPKRGAVSEPVCEVLGFPLSNSLMSDLKRIDLLSIEDAPAREVLVIESKEIVGGAKLIDMLRGIGVSVRCERFPGTTVWIKKKDEMSKSMVPVDILQCIVSWISGVSR